MGKKGHILGGGGYVADGKPRFVLSVCDLDAERPEPSLIPLGFLAHGLVFDPASPRRLATFEKKGPGACVVELGGPDDDAGGRVARPITTRPNRRFYGHGAFSADGSLLYATESLLDRDFAGVLVVRDGATLAELGSVPTFGAAPHDCQLLPDGRTMVVANGGGPIDGGAPPCVTFIDLPSERLLEKLPLDSPRFNTGHFAITSGGDLAVVSAPRDGLPDPNRQLGAVSLRSAGSALRTVAEPRRVVSRMLGETLSVAIGDDGTVFATHPLGDCVSMWRLADGDFVGTLELGGPRGVTFSLDREWLFVSHIAGASVRLSAYSARDHKPLSFVLDPSYMSGSHIAAHDPA